MNITKDQWISIAKIVLAAVLAIVAVFGYDIGVIQPREARLAQSSSGGYGSQAVGTGRFTNIYGAVGSITDLTSTNVTGTLATAAQPNITSVGTLPVATITDLTATTITATTTSTLVDVTARNITTTGTIKGAAEGNGAYNLLVDATAAEINAGHVLVTVPAGLSFRLIDATAVAYGDTCTTSTVMSLTATSDLVVYTIANLVRSTPLGLTTTGAALLADGASFTAQTAGTDLSVQSDTADTAGCTGVRFVITYALD